MQHQNINYQYLVEIHHISPSHKDYKECNDLCFIAKNLYNQTLYQLNNISSPKYNLGALYHLMKSFNEFQTVNHPAYNGRQMPHRPLKSVFRQIEWVYKSYFAALKDYKKSPHKYKAQPRPPKYLKKNARYIITYEKGAISFKTGNNKLHLSQTSIFINSLKATKQNIAEISIVPVARGFDIVVKYKVDGVMQKPNNDRYLGIDLGINNFGACISNISSIPPFILNGKVLKSINQFYNKKLAKLKSNLPKGVYTSNKTRKLTQKRHHKIKNELHHMTTYIVDFCKKHDITTLVVGVNKGWKQNVTIGKRNNQNFVSIPYYKARLMLKYKCEMAGIRYVEQTENYTSKCSAFDLEPICKHKQSNYAGKRVKRGLFETASGLKVNADINGALNILRKVAGDALFDLSSNGKLVEGYAASPVKVLL